MGATRDSSSSGLKVGAAGAPDAGGAAGAGVCAAVTPGAANMASHATATSTRTQDISRSSQRAMAASSLREAVCNLRDAGLCS
ncbi:hypothetical protein D3C87_1135080 [compost metagenome]